jgi:hypothetical protein
VRSITLCAQEIDYRLSRARRRSIGMVIDHTGLSVRAPSWVSIREIELALRERAEWVIKTLTEWRGRDKEALPTQWCQGAQDCSISASITLALFPARKKTIAADLLHLTVLRLRTPARSGNRGPSSAGGYEEQALALLAPRDLPAFCEPGDATDAGGKALQRPHAMGQLQPQGEIRLALALRTCRPQSPITSSRTRPAHLVELNHSPRFWRSSRSLLPGHVEARRELDALTCPG